MSFEGFFLGVSFVSVNEDWDVSKEVSREAKANYTKAGTGDWVHIRIKRILLCLKSDALCSSVKFRFICSDVLRIRVYLIKHVVQDFWDIT